jgi:enoyl-CoA hydratase/carnithine racemase
LAKLALTPQSSQEANVNYETILVEKSPEAVLTVTLNRPEVLNAFNEQMQDEFLHLWAAVNADDDIRAVVLAAAGDRAFCTGVDIGERLDSENPFLDPKHPWAEHEDPGRKLSPRRNEVWKPVIAAVNGMCAGGAFYWVADCDIIICAPEATFFDPHVTYGFVAALEPIALRFRMPFSDVMRMALLGLHERMTADRAQAVGLVTEVVARDSLLARAQELATVIANQPPAAVQGTVKALWQSLDATRAQALATALMYTQIGNPIGTAELDRAAAKPGKPWLR